MRFIAYVVLLLSFFSSCLTDKKYDLYEFLSICQHEFYLDYGIHLSDTLQEFEVQLIDEGHLSSSSNDSYKSLLAQLKKEIYFRTPLKKDNFNHDLLYKNPTELVYCAAETFTIDTSEFQMLPYYQLAENISNTFITEESVAIQELFNFYLQLPKEEIQYPFVKENLLLLFYRWYFSSKYNRSIPINVDELEGE